MLVEENWSHRTGKLRPLARRPGPRIGISIFGPLSETADSKKYCKHEQTTFLKFEHFLSFYRIELCI